MVAVLPERYGADMEECGKCTKCSSRTGPPTTCSDAGSGGCIFETCDSQAQGCCTDTDDKTESLLLAQLDEVLAGSAH
jgi:hypothetical protein